MTNLCTQNSISTHIQICIRIYIFLKEHNWLCKLDVESPQYIEVIHIKTIWWFKKVKQKNESVTCSVAICQLAGASSDTPYMAGSSVNWGTLSLSSTTVTCTLTLSVTPAHREINNFYTAVSSHLTTQRLSTPLGKCVQSNTILGSLGHIHSGSRLLPLLSITWYLIIHLSELRQCRLAKIAHPLKWLHGDLDPGKSQTFRPLCHSAPARSDHVLTCRFSLLLSPCLGGQFSTADGQFITGHSFPIKCLHTP